MRPSAFLPAAGALLAVLHACAPGAPPAGAPAARTLPTSAAALPRQHAPRPTVPGITPGDLMTRLYVIADDSMMGRLAGHRGNVMATDYVAAEFRRMGLEPAGENGTFFQTVPLMVKGIDPGAALRVDGAELAPWSDFSPLPPLEGTFPFGAELVARETPVVFGGTLGGELITDAEGAGKIVVLLPPVQNGAPNYRFWAAWPRGRFVTAAAVAVASSDLSPANIVAFGRSEQTALAGGGAPAARAPAGMIVTRAAAERLLGAPLAGLRPGAAGRVVSGGFRFGERPAGAPARNVVAVLRGTDPARRGEYVAISAHNDHEGFADRPVDHDSLLAYNTVMRPRGANDPAGSPSPAEWARIAALRDSLSAAHGGPRLDSIYNGADDDGSGTAALLEIAEAMAAAPGRPARSILFVSHTAEESGLLGSRYFTEHPTVAREGIVALLNMDMVGHGRAEQVPGGGPHSVQMIGATRLSSQLGAAIDAVNARRERPMDIDLSWDTPGHPANRYCRSDHFMYARFGIPIAYLSLGYHPHYHMVTDEPQYVDYEHTARLAGFLHDVARELAERAERPVVDGPRQDPNAPCRQ